LSIVHATAHVNSRVFSVLFVSFLLAIAFDMVGA
jgi:hypothetical protein